MTLREKTIQITKIGTRNFLLKWPGLIFFSYAISACASFSSIGDGGLSVANQKNATINLYCDCEIADVRPYAIIRVPWSEGIQVEFDYAIYPKALQEEWRSWNWNGTTILVGGEAYPVDLIRLGLISFDGQKIVVNQHLPSMVKAKIPIGISRKANLGNLSFSECQEFLLKTDFGPRRTIECEGVGLIALDHYSRVNRVYYPKRRLVTTYKVEWNYPKFKDITQRPPYHEELKAKLQALLDGLDFSSSCKTNFDDILRE